MTADANDGGQQETDQEEDLWIIEELLAIKGTRFYAKFRDPKQLLWIEKEDIDPDLIRMFMLRYGINARFRHIGWR